MVLSLLTPEVLIAGLAGGMVGAAIGGLPAFSLAGFIITAGEMASRNVTGLIFDDSETATAFTIDQAGLTEAIGFGPVLGPHVAFAGGVAAAAYVGRKDTFDTKFRYHQAKNIKKPLGSAPDVLLVGGAFGLFGVLVARLAAGAGVPVDPFALAIVVSAFTHRLAFGYPALGHLRDLDKSVLDMSPFEDDDRWGEDGYETAEGNEGRQVVEVWLPDHYEWENVAALGAAVGLASGYIALVSGSRFLAFGIAAAALAFLCLGLYSVPVVYHMALPAGIAAIAMGPDAEPVLAILVAGVFGVIGALLGELTQRTLYAHADTHFDPAATSILVTSLLVTLLATAGVFEPDLVPYPVL